MTLHETSSNTIITLLAESQLYAESADPMLARVGRSNAAILTVLATLLQMVGAEEFEQATAKVADAEAAVVIGGEPAIEAVAATA